MMNQSARYFIPDPSRWPIFGSLALLCMAFGAALWMNEATWGKILRELASAEVSAPHSGGRVDDAD